MFKVLLSWSMFGGDVKQGAILGKSINDVMNLRCVDYFQSTEGILVFVFVFCLIIVVVS